MREKWARRIAFLTGLLVIVLAMVFARIQNPPGEKPAPAEAGPSALEHGRQIYQQQGCPGCHSIAAQGNPRHPLDTVADKSTPAQLIDRATGAAAARDSLPTWAYRAKQQYRQLPAEDRNALREYLQSLTAKTTQSKQ